MLKHLSEITKELFYENIEPEYQIDVISGSTYTDVVYSAHGVKFIRRTQSAATNYYIQDINA